MSKFKVGQRVKIIGPPSHVTRYCSGIGDTGVITMIASCWPAANIRVYCPSKSQVVMADYYFEDELELVEDIKGPTPNPEPFVSAYY